MATAKSDIVDDVFRASYGHCFEYVEKDKTASKTTAFPTPEAARGTSLERATSVVFDVSLKMNQFSMGSYQPLGRDLIRFLLSDVDRAFAHANIHTVVLAADCTCFAVEAKIPVQLERLKKAQNQAAANHVRALPWDIDQPAPLIDVNRPTPPLLALQSTPGALRQALFEALSLIPTIWHPEPGRRLIVHVEPLPYTQPASITDFMPDDPATTGILLADDRRDEIEAVRAELTALADSLDRREWRRRARERTTELARAGCFWTLPLCHETSITGVRYEPFRLGMMRMQVGEGDLAIPRFIDYLSTGIIVDRLVGDRRPASNEASSAFYTAEQRAASAPPPPPGRYEFAVGPGGRQQRQCSVAVSVDSDFCALLVYQLALDVARRHPQPAAEAWARQQPHAPLLLRGAVYTKSRARAARGENRKYYPESAAAATPLLLSYELFDPAALYSELVRRGVPVAEMPVAAVRRDADMRLNRRNARAAATRESKKRAAAPGAEPEAKRARTDEPAEEDSDLILHVPPLAADASNDAVFERVATFVFATCALGNDYLAGFVGCSRRWSYAALVDMLHRWPHQPLVRVLRGDDPEPAPVALPLIVDWGVHERFIAASYYMNLLAQLCRDKPAGDPDATLTIERVAAAVVTKYKGDPRKLVPPRETRERMAIRLQWLVSYFTHGPAGIRALLDCKEVGWEDPWSQLVV